MTEQDVIDSRILAKELGVEHWALMRILKKYNDNSKYGFGVINFKISESNGLLEKFALLTKAQAKIIKNFFLLQDYAFGILGWK